MTSKLAAELPGTFWLFFGGWAIEQLWRFWLAPIVGAVVAGTVWRTLFEGER